LEEPIAMNSKVQLRNLHCLLALYLFIDTLNCSGRQPMKATIKIKDTGAEMEFMRRIT
jgi:hypothetical protein